MTRPNTMMDPTPNEIARMCAEFRAANARKMLLRAGWDGRASSRRVYKTPRFKKRGIGLI